VIGALARVLRAWSCVSSAWLRWPHTSQDVSVRAFITTSSVQRVGLRPSMAFTVAARMHGYGRCCASSTWCFGALLECLRLLPPFSHADDTGSAAGYWISCVPLWCDGSILCHRCRHMLCRGSRFPQNSAQRASATRLALVRDLHKPRRGRVCDIVRVSSCSYHEPVCRRCGTRSALWLVRDAVSGLLALL